MDGRASDMIADSGLVLYIIGHGFSLVVVMMILNNNFVSLSVCLKNIFIGCSIYA